MRWGIPEHSIRVAYSSCTCRHSQWGVDWNWSNGSDISMPQVTSGEQWPEDGKLLASASYGQKWKARQKQSSFCLNDFTSVCSGSILVLRLPHRMFWSSWFFSLRAVFYKVYEFPRTEKYRYYLSKGTYNEIYEKCSINGLNIFFFGADLLRNFNTQTCITGLQEGSTIGSISQIYFPVGIWEGVERNILRVWCFLMNILPEVQS